MRRGCVLALTIVVAAIGVSIVEGVEPEDLDLEEVVCRFGKTRWTEGNRVELLADPRRAWEARLDLLESAQSHIYISTFSWAEDEYGSRFRDALADVVRSRRRTFKGFQARCLADAAATGFSMFTRAFDEVRTAGARVRSYNRIPWGMAPIYDGRLHDKLLISDGRAAIVGGRNYSNEYYDPKHWWLDFGVLVEGPAVWDVQIAFLKAWTMSSGLVGARNFATPTERIRKRFQSLWETGRLPSGRSPLEGYFNERFFPDFEEPPGDTRVAFLYDNSMVWRRAPTVVMLIELVRRAQREIDIMTPFTNFEGELTDALIEAAARGVKVRVITNDRSAALRGGWIKLAAFPTIIRLVEGGIEVWAWTADPDLIDQVSSIGCEPMIMPPIALHGKVARIDNQLTIVHSSNFNIRSTYYNTEAGLAVLDRGFNKRVEELFDGLLTLSGFDLSCSDGASQMVAERLVTLLGPEDANAMRVELGGEQYFLDGMSMLW